MFDSGLSCNQSIAPPVSILVTRASTRGDASKYLWVLVLWHEYVPPFLTTLDFQKFVKLEYAPFAAKIALLMQVMVQSIRFIY